jgi:2-polyprenyl-3-methyl-5-hydroxy-6-metoxy-1,4-benzoquinol methylase
MLLKSIPGNRMNIDLINDEFYNANADRFDKVPFESILIPLILKYFTKPGCNILEIGSGGGSLALWMKNQGHTITCIEPAEKPAKKARAKGLKVYQKRFQDFTISQKFDGLIAISSLIHISRTEMPLQIERMSQLLTTEGKIEGKSIGQPFLLLVLKPA